jgi:hypothetical protein
LSPVVICVLVCRRVHRRIRQSRPKFAPLQRLQKAKVLLRQAWWFRELFHAAEAPGDEVGGLRRQANSGKQLLECWLHQRLLAWRLGCSGHRRPFAVR